MIANTVESGRQNMAALEQTVLKDNTVMPGQWVGGRVYFTPPAGETGQPKRYTITVRIGVDEHFIEVTQAANAN
jgi:hypothetical protein